MALNLFTLLFSADFGCLGGLRSAVILGEGARGSFISGLPSTVSCMPPSSVTSLDVLFSFPMVGLSVVMSCTDSSDGGVSSCGDFASLS